MAGYAENVSIWWRHHEIACPCEWIWGVLWELINSDLRYNLVVAVVHTISYYNMSDLLVECDLHGILIKMSIKMLNTAQLETDFIILFGWCWMLPVHRKLNLWYILWIYDFVYMAFNHVQKEDSTKINHHLYGLTLVVYQKFSSAFICWAVT